MTFSSIGKQRRLERLFTNGKTLVVPVDDSLIFGPKEGLLNLSETIESILSASPNAILGFKHGIEFMTTTGVNIPFIYNVTASTVLNDHTKKVLIASVENALVVGADCVAAHINFSSKYENEMLHNFATIANECDRLGVPLLAIAYPRSERDGKDYNYDDIKKNDNSAFAELVSHCTRVACELGADIIKTFYTNNELSFQSVIKAACGKPVIIAGGPKIPVEMSLNYVSGALKAGAAGISFGRNVFNSDHISSYLSVVKEILFNNTTMEIALKKYNDFTGGTHGTAR